MFSTKHIIPKKQNKKLSIEDTYHIYDTEEKKKNYFIEHILLQEDGLQREQTHGITDSGNYLQGMKKRMKTTLVCTVGKQFNCLQKDNFGIGSKSNRFINIQKFLLKIVIS